MDTDSLIGRVLASVWLLHPRAPVHPAWADDTTPDINSFFANLEFVESESVQIMPCEVEIPEEYPALGIVLSEISYSPAMYYFPSGEKLNGGRLVEIDHSLPAKINAVRFWDSLGEGPISAIELSLSTGTTLVVRHIYPPMTLGVEFHSIQAQGK